MRAHTSARLLIVLAALSAPVVLERAARACGGCFAPPGPSTQVTAHRMAFAISSKRTVLWDQIEYVGDPASWGWVLPIRGLVDVGVSSDDLFQRLEDRTQPIILQPAPPTCPTPEKKCLTGPCYGGYPPSDASSDAAFSFDTSSVDVWSSSVVGPYEAVQLSASDGSALRNWLKDHGYVVPTVIEPVIDQYVTEGFGFLALKLVPKTGTTKMVPVRIGYPGASPSLPLRMVAAGTGANVGIKLFVLGEGRWEPKNFTAVEIATSDLVWDFGAMGSNFSTLEASAISASGGKAWITETSDDYVRAALTAGIPPGTTTLDSGSVVSGLSDGDELDKVFPTRTSITISRLFASLPQSALASDLEIQASLGGKIPQSRTPPKSVGYYYAPYDYVYCEGISPPECAPGGPKDSGTSSDASFPWPPIGGDAGSDDAPPEATGTASGSFGCAMGDGSTVSFGALCLSVLGVASALRRRTRRR